jgi:hypothetical protein
MAFFHLMADYLLYSFIVLVMSFKCLTKVREEIIMDTTTLIIVIVVLVLLFGGGGGYWWTRRG